jgi:hypothetical protein
LQERGIRVMRIDRSGEGKVGNRVSFGSEGKASGPDRKIVVSYRTAETVLDEA